MSKHNLDIFQHFHRSLLSGTYWLTYNRKKYEFLYMCCQTSKQNICRTRFSTNSLCVYIRCELSKINIVQIRVCISFYSHTLCCSHPNNLGERRKKRNNFLLKNFRKGKWCWKNSLFYNANMSNFINRSSKWFCGFYAISTNIPQILFEYCSNIHTKI